MPSPAGRVAARIGMIVLAVLGLVLLVTHGNGHPVVAVVVLGVWLVGGWWLDGSLRGRQPRP